eukprot:5100789-Ditylum_brightwellii.AAC.1
MDDKEEDVETKNTEGETEEETIDTEIAGVPDDQQNKREDAKIAGVTNEEVCKHMTGGSEEENSDTKDQATQIKQIRRAFKEANITCQGEIRSIEQAAKQQGRR